MAKSITSRCGAQMFGRRMTHFTVSTGSFGRLQQRTTRLRSSSRSQTQSQIGYPEQVVSPGYEVSPGLRSFHSAVAGPAHSAHRFHPTKDFFHPFAQALAGAVTVTARRA